MTVAAAYRMLRRLQLIEGNSELIIILNQTDKIKVLTFRRLFEYGNLNSCLCAKTHKSYKPIGNFKEAKL